MPDFSQKREIGKTHFPALIHGLDKNCAGTPILHTTHQPHRIVQILGGMGTKLIKIQTKYTSVSTWLKVRHERE